MTLDLINRCDLMLFLLHPSARRIHTRVTIATNYKLYVLSIHDLRNNHIIVCISSLSLTHSLHTRTSSSFSYYCHLVLALFCLVVPKPHIPNVNYLTISLLLLLTTRMGWDGMWGERKKYNKLNDKSRVRERMKKFFFLRFIYLFHIHILE